jgi:nickel-dependent lactate racemase
MRYYYSYYPDLTELEVSDAHAIGTFGPLDIPHTDRDKVLSEAFNFPVNSERIAQLAKPEDRVVIVTDDALEPTPTVFPFYYIIQELHEAGVRDANISVVIANAGHRVNTPEEIDRKLGAEMHTKYKVYQSALNERDDSYSMLGTITTHESSVRVSLDARLKEATLIIGISGTYPNRFKGYSGGGSLLFPGLGNEEVRGSIYLKGAEQPSKEVLGYVETDGRLLIRKMLEYIPAFKFSVEMVIDRKLQIAACVTGSPASAFRVSADVASRVYGVTLPEAADVVVIDSHPFDMNLFQAWHALFAASCAVKQDGEIILVTPLRELLTHHVASLATSLKESRESLLDSSSNGFLSRFASGGAQLAAIREVIEKTSRITIVSSGLGSSDADLFGFHHATALQPTVDAAIARQGSGARVVVLTHGGLIVPRLN